MPDSLLVFDVGNTRTACAWVRGGRIRTFMPAWHPGKLSAPLPAVVGSVAPAAARALCRQLRRHGHPVWQIPYPPKVSRPLPYPKGRLGLDRIADVEAARRLKLFPCVVVDAGTVTTIDAVGPDGAYLGGLLYPGIDAGFQSLRDATPALKSIRNGLPGKIFGRSTDEGARAGVWRGTAALILHCREELRKLCRRPVSVVLTGGNAAALARLIPCQVDAHPSLTLEGYMDLAKRNGCPFCD